MNRKAPGFLLVSSHLKPWLKDSLPVRHIANFTLYVSWWLYVAYPHLYFELGRLLKVYVFWWFHLSIQNMCTFMDSALELLGKFWDVSDEWQDFQQSVGFLCVLPLWFLSQELRSLHHCPQPVFQLFTAPHIQAPRGPLLPIAFLSDTGNSELIAAALENTRVVKVGFSIMPLSLWRMI